MIEFIVITATMLCILVILAAWSPASFVLRLVSYYNRIRFSEPKKKKIIFRKLRDECPDEAFGWELLEKYVYLNSTGYRNNRFGTPDHLNFLAMASEEEYRLVELPLPNSLRQAMVQWPVVDKYAKLCTPFPPLLFCVHGKLADGLHCLYAAHRRGDSTIRAYVPKKLKVDLSEEEMVRHICKLGHLNTW